MEEKMNYTFMPSLKHRALVKITAALWNRSDIRDLVARCSTENDRLTIDPEEWQEIEDKVVGLVPKLPLPESLKKEVMHLAQRMGLEVKKWKEYHGYHSKLYLGRDVSAEFCWMPQGTMDRKSIAEVLVKDESVDITKRYILACNYCLEDDIKKLWNSMPEREKEDIHDVSRAIPEKHMLTLFWTYYITDFTKFADLIRELAEREISPYQVQFEYSVLYANKVAAEYFLQKITPGEKDESLVKCATFLANKHLFFISTGTNKYDDFEIYDAEILCFLLSQMDVEQREKLLKGNPAGVLSCLLDWPWHSFFMETANCVWGFLSEDHYELLLKVLVTRVIDGFKNCNYQELFKEFWQESPDTHRKYITGRLTLGFLLPDLFEIEDKENIRLILKTVTIEEREEFIFSCELMRICASLICSNKWDLVKFFFQECTCIPSEDIMCEIKEEFRQMINNMWRKFCQISEKRPESINSLFTKFSKERSESVNNLWTKFCQLLDDLREDNEKRRMAEGNSCPSKTPKVN